LNLPRWLGELGFEVKAVRPLVEVVPPSNFTWQWPAAFFHSGCRRLVELGHLMSDRARTMSEAFAHYEAAPGTLMATPAVLEIIAVRC
jgi:hypothetical protein